jgi:ClpP class serine protease
MQIELIAAHMDLLSRPLWAVTTESFAALMQEIASRNFFKAQAFALLKPTTLGKVPANKVTVIPVQGVLTKDCAWCGTTYGSIASAAEEAAADPSVKRIVLSVDSPGGEITGLPETAAVLSRVAKVWKAWPPPPPIGSRPKHRTSRLHRPAKWEVWASA